MKNLRKTAVSLLAMCLLVCALTSCGAKAPELQESYYYKVSFNHMSGEHMGVNLANELIRTEAETIVLYSDGTFTVTFSSSLIGTISGDDHDTGYVYQEQMYESAVLTGKYSVVNDDTLMKTKTISLDSYTAFQHNNVNENLTGTNEDGITFTATTGKNLTFNTETGLLSEFFEFYDGQYNAANTSY